MYDIGPMLTLILTSCTRAFSATSVHRWVCPRTAVLPRPPHFHRCRGAAQKIIDDELQQLHPVQLQRAADTLYMHVRPRTTPKSPMHQHTFSAAASNAPHTQIYDINAGISPDALCVLRLYQLLVPSTPPSSHHLTCCVCRTDDSDKSQPRVQQRLVSD